MRYRSQYPDAAAIKDAIDVSDFYFRELGLTQYGRQSGSWRVAGTCPNPFHHDRKAGSFKVNVESGAFKCWSCGAAGGDVIDFVQLRDDLSFLEALHKLAREWGLGE